MKSLAELVKQLDYTEIYNHHDTDVIVEHLCQDSRKVQPNSLFFCLKGENVDGHRFAENAVEKGAVALVVERRLPISVPQVVVTDTRRAMSSVAAVFYNNPSHQLKVIGITGTNGKTSTTYILKHLIEANGGKVGVIGTVGAIIGGEVYPIELTTPTTPESLDLQFLLHKMYEEGCQYVVMEVSSHALVTERVADVRFHTVVFTNLTHDHLDYHQSWQDYRAAKATLFQMPHQSAVINLDDPNGEFMAQHSEGSVIYYSLDTASQDTLSVNDITITSGGNQFDLLWNDRRFSVQTPLVGRFNVSNTLAAIGAAIALELNVEVSVGALATFRGVAGRFELVREGQDFMVIVDYAHTADALENVLTTVQEFKQGDLLVVFGCGGDRDKSKRPKMGRAAGLYADRIVVTSDNPRTEDPEAIIEDILPGLREVNANFIVQPNRALAIKKAVELAHSNDVIVIAGKGHETYQVVGTKVLHFDDREVARQAISEVITDA